MTPHPNNEEIASMRGVDMVGFIFYAPSKRFTGLSFPTKKIDRVGVFVNESEEVIREAIAEHELTHIQLHGSETPEFCRQFLGLVFVMKALGIATADDLAVANSYQGKVNYLLFDTKTPNHGGSGVTFDWRIIENYTADIPFFLSGGIGMDQVEAIKEFKHKKYIGLDLNSQFEISPGIKDPQLLKQFLAHLKQ